MVNKPVVYKIYQIIYFLIIFLQLSAIEMRFFKSDIILKIIFKFIIISFIIIINFRINIKKPQANKLKISLLNNTILLSNTIFIFILLFLNLTSLIICSTIIKLSLNCKSYSLKNYRYATVKTRIILSSSLNILKKLIIPICLNVKYTINLINR